MTVERVDETFKGGCRVELPDSPYLAVRLVDVEDAAPVTVSTKDG